MTEQPIHWACGHWSDPGPESCPVCAQVGALEVALAELRIAIVTHRLKSWGGAGYVDHPPDVDLYRVAGLPE